MASRQDHMLASSSSVQPRPSPSSSCRPTTLGKITYTGSASSSTSFISASSSSPSKQRGLQLPPIALSASSSSPKLASSPLKQQLSPAKTSTRSAHADESLDDGSVARSKGSRSRGRPARGGGKRKGAGGPSSSAAVFSFSAGEDLHAGISASLRADKGKGRQTSRSQHQQDLTSLSKKARPSSPSSRKLATPSSLSLNRSSSATKLASLSSCFPLSNRRPTNPSKAIDLNAPSPARRIGELVHYSPHLSASEAALSDSDEDMMLEEGALKPVQVAVHPSFSSLAKQSRPVNAVASSSRHLARKVTVALSNALFGRVDSPLTPLPVRYADEPREDRVEVVLERAVDDENDDEIISSSEKGEGDAEPLRPRSEIAEDALVAIDEDDSLGEVSSILPSAPSVDDSFEQSSPERSKDRATDLPSSPARDSLGDVTMASSSSNSIGTILSPVRASIASTSKVLAVASLKTVTIAERIKRDADEDIKKERLAALAGKRLTFQDSSDDDVGGVISELSDDSDELDKMEMSIRRGILRETNGTSRTPAAISKPSLRSKPTPTSTAAQATPAQNASSRLIRATGSVPRPTPASTAPGSAAARADFSRFKSLIKSTQARKANLEKLEAIKTAKFVLSDDEDDSSLADSDADDKGDTSARRRQKVRSGSASYPTPSTDRHSSVSSDQDDDASSSDMDEEIERPVDELLSEEAADQIKELLGNDKSAMRAEQRARRERRARGVGGWTGCWAWGNGKVKGSGVKFVEGEWSFIKLEGQSEDPSFALFMETVALRDEPRIITSLMCGVFTRCLPTIEQKDQLLLSLIETAALTPNANLSRLSLAPALSLLANSSTESHVIDSKTLTGALKSAFKAVGIRTGLLASLSPTSKASATKPVVQGPVFPMSETARERAIGCLTQVIEAATRSHILSASAIQLFVPLLATIALDKASSFELKLRLLSALSVMVDSVQTFKEEIALCQHLIELTSPYNMAFKHALLAVLPQAGKKASRLVVALGLIFLGRITLDQHTYTSPPSFPFLITLFSQSSEKPGPFYINHATDYDELVASIRILTLVLTDLHRVYLTERRRIDEVQIRARKNMGMEMDDDEGTGPSPRGEVEEVEGSVRGWGLSRTEVDKIPLMAPLEEAIVTCDKKILDARASDLGRTAAKAFLLNLRMSISYRTAKYKALYLRDRDRAMKLLDEDDYTSN